MNEEPSMWIKQQALQLGFDLVGIAPARPVERQDYVRQWLASGQAGTMAWLNRNEPVLLEINRLLEGAQSLICVAASYHFPLETAPPDTARVARYALGDDYHEVFKKRLHILADAMREKWPTAQTRCGADAIPILEKPYAVAAGIGWLGKNTCVLHRQWGSWLLLGEIVTTLPLAFDTPQKDYCGRCTRCLDACPTGAITAPYQLDARKCISYLNIEFRGELHERQNRDLGPWLVGCDICQDVCPWNQNARQGTLTELRPRLGSGTLDPAAVLQWDETAYRRETRNSAIRRIKLPQLQAHARAVQKNITPMKAKG